MTDDHDPRITDLQEKLYTAHQEKRKIEEDYARLARITASYDKNLRAARAEAAGRKTYADDLKNKIVKQHIELCQLTEKYSTLKEAVDAAYQLIDRHTPYSRRVPLPNVVNWLITMMDDWHQDAEQAERKRRELWDERNRTWRLLYNAGIYTETTDEGIKQLLNSKTD